MFKTKTHTDLKDPTDLIDFTTTDILLKTTQTTWTTLFAEVKEVNEVKEVKVQ